MVNDCAKSSWTPSSIRGENPATTLLRDLLRLDTDLTECISFVGGATLRPTEGNLPSKTLELHGNSEAAGLLLEHGPDGNIDPAHSLAVQFRDGEPEPTIMSSLMPVLTGEGSTSQGGRCGFVLYGFEDSCQTEGTIQGSGVYVWPPESVVRDSSGRCTLTFTG